MSVLAQRLAVLAVFVLAFYSPSSQAVSMSLSSPATSSTGNYTVTWSYYNYLSVTLQESKNGGAWVDRYVGQAGSKSFTNQGSGAYKYRTYWRFCVFSCVNYYSDNQPTTIVSSGPAPSKPGAISGPSSATFNSPATTASYTLSWGASSGTVTYYQLQEKVNSGSWATIHNSTARSRAISQPAGTYYYRVRACNGGNCSGYTATKTVTVSWSLTSTVSAPPNSNTGNYTVTWTTGMGSPVLQERKDNGAWTAVAAGTAYSKPFTNKSSGTYQYRTSSRVCWTTCGPYFYSDVVTTYVARTPGVPDSISVPVSSDGSHTISWGTASGSVSKYQLYQAPAGTSSWALKSPNPTLQETNTSRTRAISGVSDGDYIYKVHACRTTGSYTSCSGYRTGSNSVAVLNKPGIPGTINGPTSDDDGIFSLSWNAPNQGQASSYKLEERVNGNLLDTHILQSGSYPADLSVSGTYTYRVMACNSSGCSNPTSPDKTVSVSIPLPAPEIPDGLTVPAESDDGNYTVSWDRSDGTVDDYILEERYRTGTGWSNWEEVQADDERIYEALNKDANIYQYRVMACNVDDCSEYSASVQIMSHDLQGLRPEQVVVNADAVGNTPYRVDVTAAGSAVIDVPIQVAPGVNGLQPSLSVVYSSGRGRAQLDQELPEDTLGYGFQLSGFSQIRRCVRGDSNQTAV